MNAGASPTFSVIVTCYNYKAFVEETVESVLAQAYPARDVIVVDDGSTDGSTELLRARYGDDPRITLVTGDNVGQLGAFQRGIVHAHGDVVCFIDADDRWKPNHLAVLAEYYGRRKDVDFVFNDITLFGEEDRTLAYADREMDLGYTIIPTYYFAHWYGAPTSAVSLRRNWAERCLDLPAKMVPVWRISADNCLVYGTSILGGRKAYLPTGTVEYRVHGNNGWWSKRTRFTEYLNRLRSLNLIRHYAREISLDDECVELTKLEFLTKSNPSLREARRYAKLVMKRKAWFGRNLERAVAIYMRAWRKRHDAPFEYPMT